MNDDDPQTINRMLLYLYTLDYPDEDVPHHRTDRVAVDNSLPPHQPRKTSTTSEGETDPGTTLKGTAPHDPRLMNNVLVYAVAEKYDIPELKELAKSRFQTLVRSKWPHDDFDAVIESIFSTTPDEDIGLRQIVLDICEENFEDILKTRDSRAGFLENQAIAAVVLDAAVRKIDQDKMLLDEALAKQIALGAELLEANEDKQEAINDRNEWTSKLDSKLNNINDFKSCRHCHEQFQWLLERTMGFGSLGMQLRCRCCRTKEAV